jgi:DNA-binding NarL/FixJ family response regulator
VIRVLIADDHELVRTGFRLILQAESDLEVVGEAATGREAVDLTASLRPDVVLMDIRMPDLDGIEATRQVTRGAAASRVLVLTTFDLDEYVFEALQAGACGFLLKDVAANQLAAGVRMVAAGDALLAPSITRRLIEEFAVSRPRPPEQIKELTPREMEIFLLVARGMSNAEIAAKLVIGETTVKTHVTRLLMKLGVRDRIQAIVLAYEAGVVRPSQHSESEPQGTETISDYSPGRGGRR